jgi:hypothetical protein
MLNGILTLVSSEKVSTPGTPGLVIHLSGTLPSQYSSSLQAAPGIHHIDPDSYRGHEQCRPIVHR